MHKDCNKNQQKMAKSVNAFLSDETFSEKNVTSHNYSVHNTERVSFATGESRSSDGIMKHLLENARFTGFLLTRILPEMKGVSLDQFCTYTKADVDTGDSLKREATEVTSAGIKDIRLDLIFDYNAESQILLRVNEEPQTSQQSYSEGQEDSYSLVGRAVYYASLAMVTELRSKEEYHKIRKVYSIWICYKRPIPYLKEPIISYSLKPDQEYKYIDGASIDTCKHKFDNGDLFGIVLISIPDLEDYVNNGKCTEKYILEVLTDLYYLLSNNISTDDRMEFYRDTSIIKEGMEMESSITALEYADELKHQAEKQMYQAEKQMQKAEEQVQRAEEICVKTWYEFGKQSGWSKAQIIQKVAELLEADYSYAKELFEYYYTSLSV